MLEKYIVLAFVPFSYVLIETLKKRISFEILSSFCIFVFSTALAYTISSLTLYSYVIPLISFFVLGLIIVEARRSTTHQVVKVLYSIWLIVFALVGYFDFFEFMAFLTPLMIMSDDARVISGQSIIFSLLMFFAGLKQLLPSNYSYYLHSIYFVLYFMSLKLSFSSNSSYIKCVCYQMLAFLLFGLLKTLPSFVMYSSLLVSFFYILDLRVNRNESSFFTLICLLSLALVQNLSTMSYDYIVFQVIMIIVYYVDFTSMSSEFRRNLLILSFVGSFGLVINLHNSVNYNIHVLLSYILLILFQRMVYVRNFIPDSCYQPKEV